MSIDTVVMAGKIILSFDIGVKNLAYCRLSLGADAADSTTPYKILDWGIVDLVQDDTEQHQCNALKKAKRGVIGDACGKKAKWIDRHTGQCYCQTHYKPLKSKDGIELLSDKRKKVVSISNQDINLSLVRELDKLPELLECDEVLLEHQPSKNPRMKNISFMLYSYYIIRGMIDRKDSRLGAIRIRQINSEKKDTLYDGPAVVCKLKSQYDRNKFYSKAYCEYLIRNDTQWLAFYGEFKKKDDLADCFLQGAWFLNESKKNTRRVIKVKRKTTPMQ